jgi:hypothetical protein
MRNCYLRSPPHALCPAKQEMTKLSYIHSIFGQSDGFQISTKHEMVLTLKQLLAIVNYRMFSLFEMKHI